MLKNEFIKKLKVIESNWKSYDDVIIDALWDEFGMLELEVNSKIAGKTVGQINVPLEFMVVMLIKKHKHAAIPDSTAKLELGDRLVGVVKNTSLNKIKKTLLFFY